ncbi:MAG: phytoene desaturase family protein [Prochlorococcaceae cyanobacterium]|jgi:phytoene dehydrogenase-like protein
MGSAARDGRPREGAPDLVVIGSGLGGLCAGAVAAWHGLSVLVLEAHDQPGGAAHGFRRGPFHFESGPSLWSGLDRWPSPGPLAQVLQLLGEKPDVIPYDTWGLLLPEGDLQLRVGNEPFRELVRQLRGSAAADEWTRFLQWLEPYCRASTALPLLALREGAASAAVLGPARLAGLLRHAPRLARLGGAFGGLVRPRLRDPFLLHWVEMLCFLISGLPMDHTSAAAMALLFGEWFEPEARLDYPRGGSAAVVEALVRGLRRHGGELRCSSAVEAILVRQGRAAGVRLASGEEVLARLGVISNASPWDTLALLPEEALPAPWRRRVTDTPAAGSFLHLHLALEGAVPESLPIHHIWVGDWERGVTAERNMVVLSMPSVLDPGLAPPGHQVLHGYTPANEPWEIWRDLEPGSAAYRALRRERCQVFEAPLRRILPDWQERARITLQGTPRTHSRYLRLYRGTYGPALGADQGPFPGGSTPLPGLRLCGAGVFPGIGVPPVVVSGAMAAHSFVPPVQQRRLLEALA